MEDSSAMPLWIAWSAMLISLESIRKPTGRPRNFSASKSAMQGIMVAVIENDEGLVPTEREPLRWRERYLVGLSEKPNSVMIASTLSIRA